MSQPTYTHVNSARIPDYVGRPVRLAGLVLMRKTEVKELIMRASDEGKVKVVLADVAHIPKSAYAEVVGEVATSADGSLELKAKSVIEMGDMLDLSLVNFVVEAGHSPRFAKVWCSKDQNVLGEA